MALTECSRCKGTGWASAARDAGMEGVHWSQIPIGVYQCSSCGGSGKIGFPDGAFHSVGSMCPKMKPT